MGACVGAVVSPPEGASVGAAVVGAVVVGAAVVGAVVVGAVVVTSEPAGSVSVFTFISEPRR